MTPALAHHLTLRPEFPRPIPPVHDPIYQTWLKAFTAWALGKKALEDSENVVIITFQEDWQPRCTPRADYVWRDIPTRRPSKNTDAQQDKWREMKANQTPEQRERRLAAKRKRDLDRRAIVRAAVLEVQAERDAS